MSEPKPSCRKVTDFEAIIGSQDNRKLQQAIQEAEKAVAPKKNEGNDDGKGKGK